MTTKLVTSAVQTDADICNSLDPPVAGVHVGDGIHVSIPGDFAAQIAAGKSVEGCTYAKLEPNATLYVTDTVQTNVVAPNAATKLTLTQNQELNSFKTKLASATTVTSTAV